ncbi:MAG: TolC family protein [Pseudomonadota bacterium]|nr:TolC family protein [Pseudomonadota bacterium]
MRLFAFAKIFKPLGVAALLINPGFAQVIGTSPSADKARGVVEEPSVMTLRAAENLALTSNADLGVAARELEATEGAVIQGAARPNPGLAFLLEDTRKATRTTTLQLNQPIELGGKRSARLDAAERGRDIAAVELDVRRAEIRAIVTANFFGVLSAQERVRLAQDVANLAKRATEVAVRRVASGKVPPLEETKARVAEANVRIDLALAQSELRTARQQLASTWGNPSPRFERVDGRLEPLPSLPSSESINARLAESPHLKRAKIEIQRRKSLADLERAKRTPDLTVSLGAIRSEELGRNQLLLGVSIPIPVLDSNRGNQLEALKRTDKARDELAATQIRLTSEVRQAYERLRAARNEVETLQRDVLPGAQRAYDVAIKGFELGKFNFLEVLDAQRTLFQARSQNLRAVAEAHRAGAEIDLLLADTTTFSTSPAAKP